MKVAVVVAAALLAVASVASAAMRSYEGEQVLRVRVLNKEQYAKLNDFIEANLLDEWAANAHKRFVDVRMHKSKIPALETLGLKYTVHIDNLQALVDEEQARLAKRVVPTKIRALPEFFDDYHTYEEIDEFWQDLAASYPDIVNYITIGETYEGRPITGVKIGARGATKGAFFNGGQHAREWISNPTVQGIAYNLASLYYANDTEVVEFVDNIEFTIVAPLNPDGFVYTWSDDRLWRKNREPNAGAICIGVDTNRNWGYKWGTGGSSNQPCSDTYMGPSAMSSYEPQAVDAYLKSRLSAGIDVLSYIDFHAYSQLFMCPYGTETPSRTADYDDQMSVLTDIVDAIYNSGYNTNYEFGPVAEAIYEATGGSNDHTYGNLGIKYSLAAEGRDQGRYGFELPPAQIVPSIEENWAGIKVLAKVILAE